MDLDVLIDMANRIGEFFDSLPDHEEALLDIAEHIRRFWEPRMRRMILASLEEGSPDDTSAMLPIVREALVKYREKLTPLTTA